MLAFERLRKIAGNEGCVIPIGMFTKEEMLALKVAIDVMEKQDLVMIDGQYYKEFSLYNVSCLTYDGRDLAQVKSIVEIIEGYTGSSRWKEWE